MELGRALGTGAKCLLYKQKSHSSEIQKFRPGMLIITLIIKLLNPLECWGFLADSYHQVSGILDILTQI